MSQRIKVHRISMSMIDVKEVDLEEAKALVKDAYAHGHVVTDKETGDIVDEITSATKEIFITEVLGGG